MTSLISEFERQMVNLKKIQNVVQLLKGSFTLQPDYELVYEVIGDLKFNEASSQREIIDFQTNNVLKNVSNENYSVILYYCIEKYRNIEK